jgi:aminoglycoside phosphotransferase (APT) family kinase protein
VLSRICAATGARKVQRAEQIQRLWSGYGELARVWLDGAECASVIVKLVQPMAAARHMNAEQQRSRARKLRSYAVEMRFYERYGQLCSKSSRVARKILCEQQAEQWLFVLEDLDAAGFNQRRDQLPRHGVQTCLEWLAQFHATFIADPPQDLWPVGTYWHLDTRPDELARSNDPQLRAAASWLDARLRGAKYRTLVHGDAKVENFCFTEDLARVAAVDFQYVGIGTGVQDVAYFLSSCLDDRACETQAPALLDHYFDALRRALAPDVDAAALEAEWRELCPIAWADFARFMSGWAPQLNARSGYAGRMIAQALEQRASSARDNLHR